VLLSRNKQLPSKDTLWTHNQLTFESLFSREVVVDFDGGRITSDAGGLLLRELGQSYRLAENAARPSTSFLRSPGPGAAVFRRCRRTK
jgi:hypothetical protein